MVGGRWVGDERESGKQQKVRGEGEGSACCRRLGGRVAKAAGGWVGGKHVLWGGWLGGKHEPWGLDRRVACAARWAGVWGEVSQGRQVGGRLAAGRGGELQVGGKQVGGGELRAEGGGAGEVGRRLVCHR